MNAISYFNGSGHGHGHGKVAEGKAFIQCVTTHGAENARLFNPGMSLVLRHCSYTVTLQYLPTAGLIH